MDWNYIFLDPLKSLFSTIMGYLPYVVGALILLLLAWILAKIFRAGATKLVRASGIDKRMGKGGDVKNKKQWPVAEGTGKVVWWIVWIFFILAIMQVLGLKGVLSSVIVLFEKIFAAIPNILAALIVLVILYLVGRFVAGLVTKLLTNIHFNELPVKLGLAKQPIEGSGSPASIVGYIVLVFIMLFAIIMAAELLGFTALNGLMTELTGFLALVILGVVIISIGLFVANMVGNILKSGGRSNTLVSLAKISIIIIAVAIGLRAMGFANDIILLIFGLVLGAMAVASAIAFGLGGRETAGKLLERWTKTDGSKDHKTEE